MECQSPAISGQILGIANISAVTQTSIDSSFLILSSGLDFSLQAVPVFGGCIHPLGMRSKLKGFTDVDAHPVQLACVVANMDKRIRKVTVVQPKKSRNQLLNYVLVLTIMREDTKVILW